jgi:hypothetical protein
MAAETATNYGKLADANAWTGVQTFDKAEFGSDTNFHADLISTNPTITMDGSDLLVYNRSANQFRFEIAGTLEADINASGLRLGSGGTRVNQFGDLATSSLSDGLVFSGTVEVPTSTVAGVPTATAGRIAYISDESGGAVLAFADGTNWRRSTDRAIVS